MNEALRGASFAPEFASQKFDDPWQATLFAITVTMSRNGYFSWSEWVERFSAGLLRHGEALTLETYFQIWIETFCDLVKTRFSIDEDGIRAAMEDWRRSYLATPHGMPVDLQRDLPVPMADVCGIGHGHGHHEDHAHHHHHDHHHGAGQTELPSPVFVDPARDEGRASWKQGVFE